MLKPSNIVRAYIVMLDSHGGSSVLRRCSVWTLVAVWSAVVATGIGMLAAYANTAGKWSRAPAAIGYSDDASTRHRLYMFLHPRCPCSVASVNELARIMSCCAAQFDATVYFVRPESRPSDWECGTLWNLASAIPFVNVETDVGGAVAGRFQANTSGEVFVYDCRGKLKFHGGITAARGHAGDNLGETAVIAIALGDKSYVDRSPVFGCPFRSEVADNGN
jgi:hypothetical protein